MRKLRSLCSTLALLLAASPLPASAQTEAAPITLRLHQMLSADSAFNRLGLQKWAEKIERESQGRLKIEIHASMSLGGSPAGLYDQARDGKVDLSWVVLGYTPARFPSTTTFELPFMVRKGETTSRALQAFCETYCRDDFREVKVIAWHTHGPALIHSSRPISRLEDLKGLKLRPGSAAIGQFLANAGAVTVAMPAPDVYEALRAGRIEATTIPWSSEVNTTKPASDFLRFHSAAGGDRGLYTQTFALVMNPAAYERLSPELRAVIDHNSGMAAAALFGNAMDESDKLGRKLGQSRKGKMITLTAGETARWRGQAGTVVDAWRQSMAAGGHDADAWLAAANAALDKASTGKR